MLPVLFGALGLAGAALAADTHRTPQPPTPPLPPPNYGILGLGKKAKQKRTRKKAQRLLKKIGEAEPGSKRHARLVKKLERRVAKAEKKGRRIPKKVQEFLESMGALYEEHFGDAWYGMEVEDLGPDVYGDDEPDDEEFGAYGEDDHHESYAGKGKRLARKMQRILKKLDRAEAKGKEKKIARLTKRLERIAGKAEAKGIEIPDEVNEALGIDEEAESAAEEAMGYDDDDEYGLSRAELFGLEDDDDEYGLFAVGKKARQRAAVKRIEKLLNKLEMAESNSSKRARLLGRLAKWVAKAEKRGAEVPEEAYEILAELESGADETPIDELDMIEAEADEIDEDIESDEDLATGTGTEGGTRQGRRAKARRLRQRVRRHRQQGGGGGGGGGGIFARSRYGYAGGHVPMDNILAAEAEYGYSNAAGPGSFNSVGESVADAMFGGDDW